MKILTVVGARPQFIKASVVSKALEEALIDEVMVHTGQHYDHNMSKTFFEELGIKKPAYNLGVGSGSHSEQTAEMLKGIEKVLFNESPDVVLVYGDTNSTVAASLAAAKLCIPIAHVEAGLRSYDMTMPEEINRILTDRISTWLFCPTDIAVNNLKKEGMLTGVSNVGDVMYDVALEYKKVASANSKIIDKLNLKDKDYVLVTIHRDFNTDNQENLSEIVSAFVNINHKVVFPAHPRVYKQLERFGLLDLIRKSENIILIEPVGYLDMIVLESKAKLIITDSGGIQKEAFFHAVPCITVRPSTEWVETVDLGWNKLVDADCNKIISTIDMALKRENNMDYVNPYGAGNSSSLIASILKKSLGQR
jgi:UDP-GlcNAc3NAcA epimerase